MTVLAFIIILSILVFIHELGHFLAAKKVGVKVEEFGLGFPPRAFGKKVGETLYSLNWLPIGGFVKVYGEEYHEDDKIPTKDKQQAFVYKKPWEKLFILVAGVVMNFLLGWVLISYLFTQGVPQPTGVVEILAVTENSPAATVGLQKGDRITQLEQNEEVVKIERVDQLISTTARFAGEPMVMTVERGEQTQELTVTPRENPPKGEGSLGIELNTDAAFKIQKYPWYTAPFYGLQHAATITATIMSELGKALGQLITFDKPAVEFSGPIGIANYTGVAIQYGPSAVIELIALLSLNLAVINLLPFPALDGGRVVFVLYEWISGKRVNTNFERYLNLFGIIALLTLTVVVTYFDIVKLFTGGK